MSDSVEADFSAYDEMFNAQHEYCSCGASYENHVYEEDDDSRGYNVCPIRIFEDLFYDALWWWNFGGGWWYFVPDLAPEEV